MPSQSSSDNLNIFIIGGCYNSLSYYPLEFFASLSLLIIMSSSEGIIHTFALIEEKVINAAGQE